MYFYKTFLSLRNAINERISQIRSCESELANNARLFKEQSAILEKEYLEEYDRNEENKKKVTAFIRLAEAHSSVRRQPSGPERFSSIELSRLAVQIDNASHNDESAAKLYPKAIAQQMYLTRLADKLLENYKYEIDALSKKISHNNEIIIDRLGQERAKLLALLTSEKLAKLISLVTQINEYSLNTEVTDLALTNGCVFVGFAELPILSYTEFNEYFIKNLGIAFSSERNTLRFPFDYNLNRGGVLLAEYTNGKENEILSLFQAVLLNTARYFRSRFDEIVFIDPVRYNNSALGALSILTTGKKSFISKVPTSQDSIRKKIESLIANLEVEENKVVQSSSSVLPKLLIFHNFPQGYDTSIVSKIKQLCVNANHYNYTIILSTNIDERKTYIEDALGYIKNLSETINCSNGVFSISDDSANVSLTFFNLLTEIPQDILVSLIENKKVEKEGNEYINRVGLNWSYENKGTRFLDSIPYGVDKENELLTLDFENSNFATFICGASRSGKSTLLHTILTGIFTRYHPDDVEVWLIDFKMTEFSRYTDHLPPHVRYLILDESPELVYDIINRLTEILIKRQNRFKGKWEKLSQVPKEKYMPSVFVVIDEFSVMSQIIADSVAVTNDNYSAKLQMLLAKGAALGLHFIFSSQGFTNGTRGLSEYSKEQIQQRIAMKTQFAEIKTTLDLKNASDTDIAMMEQLPVYHTLTRIPMDGYGNHLRLANVLYFPDEDKFKQTSMIEEIRERLTPVPKFQPYDSNTYIDKKALIIDGNKYKTFAEEYPKYKDYIFSKQDSNSVFFIGEPRRMLSMYPIEFSESFCENIMAISPASEKMAFTSILLSIAKTVELQGYTIKILGHSKNQTLNQILYGCHCKYECITSLRDICREISHIKNKVVNGIDAKVFYFLLGFETIINEMSFIDDTISNSAKKQKSNDEKLASVVFEKREEGELDLLQKMDLEMAEPNSNLITTNQNQSSSIIPNSKNETNSSEETIVEYDARKDLKFILTQGSRLGYHFVMQFNSVNELEQTKTDLSFFRHKILFRVPRQDASSMVGASFSAVIPNLPDHVFRYHDGISAVSFRPFLHPGLTWDGWSMNVDGTFSDSDDDDDEYLM